MLYEAPHRVVRTVGDLAAVCDPGRPIVLARELTKLHEEWFRGSLGAAVDWLDAHEPRGEFVIVLGGAAPPAEATDDDIRAALHDVRTTGRTTRDAVAAVARELGVSKRRVYDLATE